MADARRREPAILREATDVENKTVMLSFRVSEFDERMIKEAATEAGLSVSDWIRARIVGRL